MTDNVNLKMNSTSTIPSTFGMPGMSSYSSNAVAAVPMKLYANWEVDRASSSAIQRVFSMNINKVQISKLLKPESMFVIAVRLQGHKRTLRSNDIPLPSNPQGNSVDLNVDISFTIQYCHFLKRKTNVLQILLQRRKRYKNRHIPGFKSLAIGYLNLDDVLQMGGPREVKTWDTASLNKNDADLTDFNAGIVFIANCQSQAFEAEGTHKVTGKEGMPLSDDDEDDTTEDSDYELENAEYGADQTPRYGPHSGKQRRSRKKLNQKNIKSKLTALLKRFRAQEGSSGRSTGRLPPTAEELEEIFEELENISDSGPELEPDKMSIMSNPKPGLRPFFGSKAELQPIEDALQSEDSAPETDGQDSSSENEGNPPFFLNSASIPSTAFDTSRSAKTSVAKPLIDEKKTSISARKSDASQSIHAVHFDAVHDVKSQSIAGNNNKKSSENMVAEMMTQLEDPNLFIASNIWLTSSCDLPWVSKVDVNGFKIIRLIDCPTVNEVRAALQAIVSRIQKFCNSNSGPPPQTIIGILGGDKLIINVLRIYVDLLQNKTAQDWLNYLRFSLLIPPNSVIGRTLAMIADSGLMEVQWKNLNKLNASDTAAIEDCLMALTTGGSLKPLNIPIGEVMIQLCRDNSEAGVNGDTAGESQVFIPFIAEIHLGNLEELNSLHYVKKEEDESNIVSAVPAHVSSNMSPPMSPQMSKNSEWKELQIEYWTTGSGQNEMSANSPSVNHGNSDRLSHPSTSSAPSTPKPVNGGKFSMKASVRTLSIAREPLSTLLSMIFVKERRKDKVLQKLGRKTKPKSADNFNSQSRVVSNVTRMICSCKNNPLEVSIDGVTWSKIRFFQITSQWQTHVKFLPVSVPSSTQR